MNGGGGKASTRLLPPLCRQLPPAWHRGCTTARFSITAQPELLRRFRERNYLPQLVTSCPTSFFPLSSGEVDNSFIFADVPEQVRSSQVRCCGQSLLSRTRRKRSRAPARREDSGR